MTDSDLLSVTDSDLLSVTDSDLLSMTDSDLLSMTTAPCPEGGAGPLSCGASGASAALDAARVLEHATAAVLRLGHQVRATLLDRQVPGTWRQFGDRLL